MHHLPLQSRPDRDRYVRVVRQNVASYAREQFGKRKKREASTRGFAYDYRSVMHYGKTYFSVNAEPTLEVIGVGKELKLRIGQREGLSDIDIAQLRDMYYCNQKDTTHKGNGTIGEAPMK